MSVSRNLLLLALGTGFAAASTSAIAAPTVYALDPGHTQIVATWFHKGLSHPNAVFPIAGGTLVWDADKPDQSSIGVDILINQASTFDRKLDEHFASVDLFDTSNFPSASFKSSAVARADGDDNFTVTGNLTVKGKSVPVTLQVHVNRIDDKAVGFDATATVKRSELGVGLYPQAVADDVKLRITGEGFNASPDVE